jgi:uncharacterized membrane protein
MGSGMGLMGLWMLLPVALVLGALWLAARGYPGGRVSPPEEELEAILRRRLASGQIDMEQYARARAALGLSEGSDGR